MDFIGYPLILTIGGAYLGNRWLYKRYFNSIPKNQVFHKLSKSFSRQKGYNSIKLHFEDGDIISASYNKGPTLKETGPRNSNFLINFEKLEDPMQQEY